MSWEKRCLLEKLCDLVYSRQMIVEPGLEKKIEYITSRSEQTLAHALGISYTRLERSRVEATMPVDKRTMQPFGLLHGGASLALAESLASVGGWLNVDESKYAVVGIEINANHVRSAKSGTVTGCALPLHRGAATQVWEVKITDQKGHLLCVSRCTLAVIKSRS